MISGAADPLPPGGGIGMGLKMRGIPSLPPVVEMAAASPLRPPCGKLQRRRERTPKFIQMLGPCSFATLRV